MTTNEDDNAHSHEFTIRDEANALVACTFRNGPLKQLHAGKHSPLLEDQNLSRITDTEMRNLMINACETLARLLQQREDDPIEYQLRLREYGRMYCTGWIR